MKVKILSILTLIVFIGTYFVPVINATEVNNESNSLLDELVMNRNLTSEKEVVILTEEEIQQLEKSGKALEYVDHIGHPYLRNENFTVSGSGAFGQLMYYKVNGKIVFCIEATVPVSDWATSTGLTGSHFNSFSTLQKNTIRNITSFGLKYYKDTGNSDYLYATQVLIWSVSNPSSFTQDSVTSAGTSINNEINILLNEIQEYNLKPSFMSSTESGAKTYTLKWDGSKYTVTTEVDSNGVANKKLQELNGKTISGYTYSLSNNKLTISTTNPNTANSTLEYEYVPYETADSYYYDAGQDLFSGSADPMPLYLKLEVEEIQGKFEIKKTGREYDNTYETLKDVEFTIYQDIDNNGSYETEVDKVYTDNKGYYIDTEWRQQGKYLIKESAVGDNYYANYEEEIEISTPGQNIYSLNNGEYIVNEKITGSLKLTKYIENDSECSFNNDLVQVSRNISTYSDCVEYGANVGFKMYADFNSNGILEDYEMMNQQVEEVYTNDLGVINFDGYDTTQKYILVETTALEGYVPIENIVIDFTTGTFDNGVYYLDKEIVNELIRSSFITLTKTDSVTGEKLQGAEFELLKNVDGNYVPYSHEENDTYVTDENGEIILDKVLYGEYALREIKAPNGYIVNSTLIPFTVNEEGITIDLAFKNDKQPEITIKTTGTFSYSLIVLTFLSIVLVIMYQKVRK